MMNGSGLKQAITSDMLAQIYGVRARVGMCELGTLQIIVDGADFTARA